MSNARCALIKSEFFSSFKEGVAVFRGKMWKDQLGLTCAILVLLSVAFAAEVPLNPSGCDSRACDRAVTFVTDLFTFLADDGLREDQVEALCREGQSLKACKDYVQRCVPSSAPNIHDFFQGSVQLFEICASQTSKEIIGKFRAMNACDDKVNASVPTFNKCENDLSEGLSQWVSAFEEGIFTSGVQLHLLCCAFKNYIACDGTSHERICGPTNSQPSKSIYAAFQCGKKVMNCHR